MRVHELAQSLGITTREVLEKCAELGFVIPDSSLASLSKRQRKAITKAFNNYAGSDDEETSSADIHEPDLSPNWTPSPGSASSDSSETSPDSTKCPRCGGYYDANGKCKRCNYRAIPKCRSNGHIGMYGVTQSGKTVFLASLTQHLLTMTRDEKAQELLGWRPSVPSDKVRTDTSDICRRIINGEPIDPTLKSEYRRFHFSFRRRSGFAGSEKYSFESHDLSGEIIEEWIEGRHISKDLLSRLSIDVAQSVGLILLIDPTHEIEDTTYRGLEDSLWRSLIDRLVEEQGGETLETPIVFVLTKADLESVADVLCMPTSQDRQKSSLEPMLYEEMIERQDIAARKFVHDRMPQIWSVIDPGDPQRVVKMSKIICISSTGLNGVSLKERGSIQPWRVTEPFVWILERVRPWRRRHARKIRIAMAAAIVFCSLIAWKDWDGYQKLGVLESEARRVLATNPARSIKLCDKADDIWSLGWRRRTMSQLRKTAKARLNWLEQNTERLRISSLIASMEVKFGELQHAASIHDVSQAKILHSLILTELHGESSQESIDLSNRVVEYFDDFKSKQLANVASRSANIVSLAKRGKAVKAKEQLDILVSQILPWNNDDEVIQLLKKLKSSGEIREAVDLALAAFYEERFDVVSKHVLVGRNTSDYELLESLRNDVNRQEFLQSKNLIQCIDTWRDQYNRHESIFVSCGDVLQSVKSKLKHARREFDAEAARDVLSELNHLHALEDRLPSSLPKDSLLNIAEGYYREAKDIVEVRKKFESIVADGLHAQHDGRLRRAKAHFESAEKIIASSTIRDILAVITSRISKYDKQIRDAIDVESQTDHPQYALQHYDAALAIWPEGQKALNGRERLLLHARQRMNVLLSSAEKAAQSEEYSQAYAYIQASRVLAAQIPAIIQCEEIDRFHRKLIGDQVNLAMDKASTGETAVAIIMLTEARLQRLTTDDDNFIMHIDHELSELIPGGTDLWKQFATESTLCLAPDASIVENDITYFYNTIGIKFVLIKPDDTTPSVLNRHVGSEITSNSMFYMSATEMTEAHYAAVFKRDAPAHPNHPIGGVSFSEAREFCRKLSSIEGIEYSLPTSLEWVSACTAGTTCPPLTPQLANFYQGNRTGAVEVESYPANIWGLYDMRGNVWEWCSDPYTDPEVTRQDQRIRCGGSYLSQLSLLDCWKKAWLAEHEHRPDVGFRIIVRIPLGPHIASRMNPYEAK